MRDRIISFAPREDAELQWLAFEEYVRGEASAFFDAEGPIVGARAPGRLDIMGGVADYSGSIVLEMPIAEAACVAWQWRGDRDLRIRSVGVEEDGFAPEVTLSIDDLVDLSGQIRPVEEVRTRLTADDRTRWAAYVAGCLHVMLAAYTRVTQGMADSPARRAGGQRLVAQHGSIGRRRFVFGCHRGGDDACLERCCGNTTERPHTGCVVPAGREYRGRCAVRNHGSGHLRLLAAKIRW